MNTKPFDLVIFDCDGVLVDSEPLDSIVFDQIMREQGYELGGTGYLKKFSGMTLPDRITIMSRELNWTPPANFLDVFKERIIAITETELQSIPGIHDLIESLPVPICVASNGSREEVVLRLKISRLAKYFDNAIFSGLEVPYPKPAPDVYLAAAKAFNVPPGRCIVVEDSVLGVTAAVRAGMRVYGHTAVTPAESLREAGAIPFGNMLELQTTLRDERKAAASHREGLPYPVSNPKVDTALQI